MRITEKKNHVGVKGRNAHTHEPTNPFSIVKIYVTNDYPTSSDISLDVQYKQHANRGNSSHVLNKNCAISIFEFIRLIDYICYRLKSFHV